MSWVDVEIEVGKEEEDGNKKYVQLGFERGHCSERGAGSNGDEERAVDLVRRGGYVVSVKATSRQQSSWNVMHTPARYIPSPRTQHTQLT